MSTNVHPSIAISTADQPVRHDHSHRRVLVGPLPETLVAQAVKKKKSLPNSSENALNGEGGEDVPEVVKNNAFNFFIRRGGRAEEWGENEERGVREEMLRRWKDSEWAAVWSSRKRKSSRGASEASHKWVGGSFEVGEFLGADILQDIDEEILNGEDTEGTSASRRTHRRSVSGSQVTPQGPPPVGSASLAHDTSSLCAGASISRLRPDNETVETSSFDSSSQRHSGPISSDTYLLRSSAEHARPNHLPESRSLSEPVPCPPTKKPSISPSDGSTWFDRKGKGKHVRYGGTEVLSPVSEVLEGNGDVLGNATACASTIPEPVQSAKCDDDTVIMKGSLPPTLFVIRRAECPATYRQNACAILLHQGSFYWK